MAPRAFPGLERGSHGERAAALDLGAAVAQLPEAARLVFLLHDVEGFKHREVGEILGMRVGTTKSQLFRARRMLRGFLRGDG